MGSKKIIGPLNEVAGYLYNTPLIVEPKPEIGLNLIISEIKNVGSKVKGIHFGNALGVELPLESLKELSKSRNLKKLRFDGDYKLLRGNVSEEEKFDRYLTELLSFIEQTPIIVRTIDGLKEEDKVKVEELTEKAKNDLDIINSFSAILPLRRIEELAEFSRVVHIWYDQPLFTSYKHGGEVRCTLDLLSSHLDIFLMKTGRSKTTSSSGGLRNLIRNGLNGELGLTPSE